MKNSKPAGLHSLALLSTTWVALLGGPTACGSPQVQTEPSTPTPTVAREAEATPTEKPGTEAAPPKSSQHEAASSKTAPAPESPKKEAEPEPPPRCPEGTKLVPGGSYTTAVNRRKVEVGDLCVDTYETTAAEYKACVDAGKCTTNLVLCSEQSTWGKEALQNHPMVCVDFSQAVAYCGYQGKRLPETAEWEWVARGADAARKYPWGDEDPDDQLCWQGKKPLEGTCEVGSFPQGVSAHGIHDLSGSVHEFTTTAQDETGKIRIARGGSWKEGDPHMMWPGRIGGFETSYRCGFLGIRCVVEAAPMDGGASSAAQEQQE